MDLILHIEETINNKNCVVNFPVFYKISAKDELEELDEILQKSINTGIYSIQFSEIDIVSATEVFNHNDAIHELSYNDVGKKVNEFIQT